MQLQIISLGNKMPSWINDGFKEYSVRIGREYNLKLSEIALIKRSKSRDLAQIMQQEGSQMLSKINADDINITLEISGKNWSTTELSEQLRKWQQNSKRVNFLIGGPEGLATNVLAKSSAAWSLSNLTLPHPLVRVILIEQLYRAISILNNHPYHK